MKLDRKSRGELEVASRLAPPPRNQILIDVNQSGRSLIPFQSFSSFLILEYAATSMSVLRNLAIGVGLISFITFVALFGQLPALRRTPIGWLQRLLCLHTPNGLRTIDRAVTGGRITNQSRELGQYLFYEKNPVVLVGLPQHFPHISLKGK